ncbi:MAG: 3-deoxy-manno-octulosonate cytidylyltransferase [Endomicrobium sp.]|jgi:3-deoxy-manno-octulosonate cytidylyltransferase (CMP-KDO synthetase)|nr:3-deoxy-manno-octulosonate cytidylyltransferase [Endomicrobium sp.]
MKVAVIIPSRYDSSRFPGKPLALVNDKFLVQHTIERIEECKKIDFMAVATDDERIYNAVKRLGFNVFMTPKFCRSGTERVAFVASNFLKKYEIFINVQGDEPLIDSNLVDRLAVLLKKFNALECITAAFPITDISVIKNPNIVKVVFDKYGYALYFSRSVIPYNRDNVKIKYYKHMGIYGYGRKFLLKFSKGRVTILEKTENLEQLRILENGQRMKVVVAKYDSLAVDVPGDILNIVQYLEYPHK